MAWVSRTYSNGKNAEGSRSDQSIVSIMTNWYGSGRQLLVKRHSKIVLRHLTFKKLGNISLNLLEYAFRKNNLKSAPVYLKIETTHYCHLKCPGCRHSSTKETQMGFKDFKKIVDPFIDTLSGISFSHLGEPLWCCDLPKMMSYAHNNNIGTMFPSNLSIPISDIYAEELIRSGLDLIMVSLDGTIKETYNGYRRGGNFELVLENVKKLSDAKTRLDITYPDIQWKFTVFDHNKHEIDHVIKNYRYYGFDSYSIEHDRGNKKNITYKLRKSYENDRRRKHKACFWPWNVMIVAWDGDVQPCCWTYKDHIKGYRTTIGNAIKNSSKDIWHGSNYSHFREGFNRHNYGARMYPVCKLCIGIE